MTKFNHEQPENLIPLTIEESDKDSPDHTVPISADSESKYPKQEIHSGLEVGEATPEDVSRAKQKALEQ